MVWIFVLLGLYVLLLLVIAWVSVHPPRIPLFLSPGALGIPQENVDIHSEDGVLLKAWWCGAENPTGIAVFSHGYVMNRSELAPVAMLLHRHGMAGILYDFRNHGGSGSAVTTFGVKERMDVKAAVQYARSRCPNVPVVLVGSSMGSASSALALADDPKLADALILDSCFSRMASASLGWWRFLGGQLLAIVLSPVSVLAIPLVGFNPFRVDIAKALETVKQPVLILHGDKDNLALPSEAKRNQAACNAELVWFEGCGHSEGRWIHPELYERTILAFLRQNGFCHD